MLKRLSLAVGVLGFTAQAPPAFASFHLMQIEQVIAGVNGDTTRQAIQLRMRMADENLVQQARIYAWDATGANPILVVDLTAAVANAAAGSRVLVATAGFMPGLVPDAVITTRIPDSYLAAGRLTWEADPVPPAGPGGAVYWSLAWGGSGYTGSNAGSTFNDANGNYGPPFAGPLPSSNTQALRFPGAAGALSTSNSLDYQVTPGAAVFTKNSGSTTTVPVELMRFEVD